jgi:hypothetical protein
MASNQTDIFNYPSQASNTDNKIVPQSKISSLVANVETVTVEENMTSVGLTSARIEFPSKKGKPAYKHNPAMTF